MFFFYLLSSESQPRVAYKVAYKKAFNINLQSNKQKEITCVFHLGLSWGYRQKWEFENKIGCGHIAEKGFYRTVGEVKPSAHYDH